VSGLSLHWFGLWLAYLGWQGKQVRDVLFVEDMLALLDVQMSKLSSLPEVLNVGGGASNAISLREATSAMQDISSRSTSVTQSEKARQGDVALYFTDNRKASQHFGCQPRTDLRAVSLAPSNGFARTSSNYALAIPPRHSDRSFRIGPPLEASGSSALMLFGSNHSPFLKTNTPCVAKEAGQILSTTGSVRTDK
jgi:hypothetical protein